MAVNRYRLAEAYVQIGANAIPFNTTLAGVRATLVATQAQLVAVAAVARRMFFILGGAMAFAIFQSAKFEQAMARVKAITGATGREFDSLRQKARELGRTTVYSAHQAAEAMSAFALAGFKSEKIIAAMPHTLNLAAAGQLQMGQAAGIVAKIMAGMGLTAGELEDAVDVLVKAFTTANTDLVQLGDAMKYVGPVAKAAGKDIREIVAAIQVLSNAGMQGSMAGTALRSTLAKMAAEGPPVRKVFGSIGVSVKNVAGHIRSLPDIIDDFNAALKRQGREAEAMGLAMEAFGLRAGPGFVQLLAVGGDEIRRYMGLLDDAGGTAQKIAETQMDTLIGRLKILWSAISDVAIEIGDVFNPILRKLSDHLSAFLAKMGELNATQKDAIATWGLFTAAALGFLIIAPKLVGALIGIVTALQTMTAWATGAAVSGGPLTLLILALGLLAAAFVTARMKGETLGETVAKMTASITGMKNAVTELNEVMATNAKFNAMIADQESRLREADEKEKDTEEETDRRSARVTMLDEMIKEAQEGAAEARGQARKAEREALESQGGLMRPAARAGITAAMLGYLTGPLGALGVERLFGIEGPPTMEGINALTQDPKKGAAGRAARQAAQSYSARAREMQAERDATIRGEVRAGGFGMKAAAPQLAMGALQTLAAAAAPGLGAGIVRAIGPDRIKAMAERGAGMVRQGAAGWDAGGAFLRKTLMNAMLFPPAKVREKQRQATTMPTTETMGFRQMQAAFQQRLTRGEQEIVRLMREQNVLQEEANEIMRNKWEGGEAAWGA